MTITSNAKIEIWLDPSEGNGYLVCKAWFRFDNCVVRKCRFIHDDDNRSINHLRCFTKFDTNNTSISDNDRQELSVLSPISLNELIHSEYSRIRFIAVDRCLVYDKSNKDVWFDWYNNVIPNNINNKKLNVLLEDNSDEEQDYEDENEDEDNKKADNDNDNEKAYDNHNNDYDDVAANINGISLDFDTNFTTNNNDDDDDNYYDDDYEDKDSESLSSIFVYPKVISKFVELLTVNELTSCCKCSKHLKKNISNNNNFIKKRKELASEINRKKKEEQKKRIKQSHLKKNEKKDGYSRGRVRT